jgi:hypothetical protein
LKLLRSCLYRQGFLLAGSGLFAKFRIKHWRMVYQKFHPAEILTPFVECYFAWESGDTLEKELVVESPPSSFCCIAIN